MSFRSARMLAGAIVLLAGTALALASGIVFNAGASAIIHVALGVSFLLIASAVFDFRLPGWANWLGCIGIAGAGGVFLLQGISDMVSSAVLADFAYNVLGQYLEKALGYVFILWCAALVLSDSRGWSRIFGSAALALVIMLEAYA